MSDHNNPLFNQSLEKGLAVLRGFGAARRTMNLADIAQVAGISKSSAQRMIHTLEELGYVRKHPQSRRFQLTPKVMEIGYNYLAADILVDVANPYLAELNQITGETVNLTEPDGLDMVYVARFVAPKFIPVHMPMQRMKRLPPVSITKKNPMLKRQAMIRFQDRIMRRWAMILYR